MTMPKPKIIWREGHWGEIVQRKHINYDDRGEGMSCYGVTFETLTNWNTNRRIFQEISLSNQHCSCVYLYFRYVLSGYLQFAIKVMQKFQSVTNDECCHSLHNLCSANEVTFLWRSLNKSCLGLPIKGFGIWPSTILPNMCWSLTIPFPFGDRFAKPCRQKGANAVRLWMELRLSNNSKMSILIWYSRITTCRSWMEWNSWSVDWAAKLRRLSTGHHDYQWLGWDPTKAGNEGWRVPGTQKNLWPSAIGCSGHEGSGIKTWSIRDMPQ